ncbi:MAG: sodium:solute symporter family protein [Eubacteriales bacterium]|nr:sodium:solute symporter family protein [Eubacteriales bacterium]
MPQLVSILALLVYFVILIYLGFKDRQAKSSSDYFFAGQKLPFWALSITFIASWWGAGSALSSADLAFAEGLGAFWYYGVPVLLSSLMIFLLSGAIRRLPYKTQGEMMEARYSPLIGRLISWFILLFMTFAAASQVVGVGKFFSDYLNISYEAAAIIGTSIVVCYSLFGGFRGVVLTDIIQFVLLLLSALIVFFAAWKHAPGLGEIAEIAARRGNADYLAFFSRWQDYVAYVLSFSLAWAVQANIWQRVTAAKSVRDARLMSFLSFILFIPLYLIVVWTGIFAIASYSEVPVAGIIPALVSNQLSPVLASLVFVGISAAIMSTMDSLINTGALSLTVDLWQKHGNAAVRSSRLATALVSGVALLIGLKIRSILEITWIASDFITTGTLIPLVMGFVWRRGNSKGALASIIVGFLYTIFHLAVSLGMPIDLPYELHSAGQIGLGLAISLTTYILFSLLTPAEYERADAFIKFTMKK